MIIIIIIVIIIINNNNNNNNKIVQILDHSLLICSFFSDWQKVAHKLLIFWQSTDKYVDKKN